MITIRNRYNNKVIFEADVLTMKEAVELAIKSSADLRFVDLRSADLSFADLRSADLRFANLSFANLRFANLSFADLRFVDLSSADLRWADLRSANLSFANLSYAKNSTLMIARTRILPEGSLIGWKKCADGIIVKLRIPEKAKRSHAFGRKCRCEYAKVLDVIGADIAYSTSDARTETEYRKGKVVKCDEWDEVWTQECAGGIHFYITKEEAEAH